MLHIPINVTIKIIVELQLAVILYAFAGYPLLMWILAKFNRQVISRRPFIGTVTIVIAAYNEAAKIAGRIREFIEVFDKNSIQGEIIIISDGSTDGTASAAQLEVTRLRCGQRVRIMEMQRNVGKAGALTAGCAEAKHPIIVFADARQHWAPDALPLLLENFCDDQVGAASGELEIEDSMGVLQGVGVYWKYERWLRGQEAISGSTLGVTGAISAVRREMFVPIPTGTILDDVYWPLRVAMQGKRVVHDSRAKAFDRLPPKALDEFWRKVRTLTGNFQLIQQSTALMLPWRNPLWFRLISHKLLRLVVPWCLLILLIGNAFINEPMFRILLAGQLLGYAMGIIGVCTPFGSKWKVTSAAGSFLILNAAAWLSFWVWIFGKTSDSWRKVQYVHSPTAIKVM